jgi:hypothetical protein
VLDKGTHRCTPNSSLNPAQPLEATRLIRLLGLGVFKHVVQIYVQTVEELLCINHHIILAHLVKRILQVGLNLIQAYQQQGEHDRLPHSKQGGDGIIGARNSQRDRVPVQVDVWDVCVLVWFGSTAGV